jgi:hypothetical protein
MLKTENFYVIGLDNNSAYIVYNTDKKPFLSLICFKPNNTNQIELEKLLKYYGLELYELPFSNTTRFISIEMPNKEELQHRIDSIIEFFNAFDGMNEKTIIDESLLYNTEIASDIDYCIFNRIDNLEEWFKGLQ